MEPSDAERSICRTCGSQSQVTTSVSHQQRFTDVQMLTCEAIMKCASVQVSKDDELPGKLCTECFVELGRALRFRDRCEATDKHLRTGMSTVYPGLQIKTERPSSNLGIEDPVIAVLNSIVDSVSSDSKEMRIKEEDISKEYDVSYDDLASYNSMKVELSSADDGIFSQENDEDEISANEEVIVKKEMRRGRGRPRKKVRTKILKEKRPHYLYKDGVKKVFSCNDCQSVFNQKSHLIVHTMTHTGEKPWKCQICEYRTSRNSHLKIHMRGHLGDKPFECDVCHHKCLQKGDLVTHKRQHTGEKPFACDECDKRFAQNSLLLNHKMNHSGLKPFQCDVCAYRCNVKSSLIVHMRIHTGDKAGTCEICGYQCAQRSSLIVHMRTHTGEKPYRCDVCETRFSLKHHLTRHEKTHTGEKPYKCDICKACFTRRTYLNNHTMTHRGAKPFNCDFCSFACVDKRSLIRHINVTRHVEAAK